MSLALPRFFQVKGEDGRRPPKAATQDPARPARVEASEGNRLASITLAMVSAILFFLVLNLVVVSPIEAYTSQKNLYSELRLSLAEGSTPVSPLTHAKSLVTPGTPVAVMSAPEIGLGREVIVEGSAPAQTMAGVGHRRDTVLPCQVGSSVLMARSGSYGAVGAAWSQLQNGQRFTVVMGQGACTYQVVDRRVAGDQAPKALTGRQGRVTLTTATGGRFSPTGTLLIDADLVSKAYPRPAVVFPSGALPASEQSMGSDTSGLFPLVLLLELLLGVVIAATWLWRRWGRWQTWLVATPILLTFGLFAATDLNLLLPNLL
ncbi:MAG: hypothetical protein JWP75_4037 [Frondihabitans sp.]|nr:hypothetical protein [Frondihabitans sp.]